jgi:hypothetical protein
MRYLSWIVLALLLSLSVRLEAQIPGLPTIDFQRYFPHLVAVSEEAKDKEFPEGVQYKFLTVRDEHEDAIFIALVRRDGPDHVVREFLAKGPVDKSEETLRETVNRFSTSVHLKFEFIDLRQIRTFEEFKARAASLGWGTQIQSK